MAAGREGSEKEEDFFLLITQSRILLEIPTPGDGGGSMKGESSPNCGGEMLWGCREHLEVLGRKELRGKMQTQGRFFWMERFLIQREGDDLLGKHRMSKGNGNYQFLICGTMGIPSPGRLWICLGAVSTPIPTPQISWKLNFPAAKMWEQSHNPIKSLLKRSKF